MKLITGFIFLSLLISGCQTYSDNDVDKFDEQIQAYLKKNDIECESSSSGLYYKIINEGNGNIVQTKDIVQFTYKGTFIDGKVFDEQKEPVEFEVGALIAAWKEIMLKLREGGEAFIVAPPQLGYGSHKLEDIPSNSILVYELKVIEVK